jgi:hypothetical protein
MGASTLVMFGIQDPTIVDVIACREALDLVLDLNISRVIIASGCQGAMKDINDGSRRVSGAILAEIERRRSLLRLYTSSIKV